MNRLLITLFSLFTFHFSLFTYAEGVPLRLASPLTDNMVLQQQTDARLWGEAPAGSTISIECSWLKAPQKVKADSQGRWQAKVHTPTASYDSHTITFSISPFQGVGGSGSLTLHDILIGEVWLASGQSNMEMPLKGFAGCCVKDGTQDAIQAHNEAPYVRMYTVKKSQSMHRQDYCEGTWQKTTFPETMEFSATAYYFASALSNALRIPVGIVNASYGGAHVESWTPEELCREYPDIPTDSASVYSFGTYDFDRPLLMYNAMFHPVRQYTYNGIIWYQGCSNIGHADVYPERLSNMVQWWRKEIGCGDIPFYQVEIAPYEYGDGTTLLGALLREAQHKATSVIPNCDIISTNDAVETYERWNIHPRQKRIVGNRLAFLALNKKYGMTDISCHGPRAKMETFRVITANQLPEGENRYQGYEGKIAAIAFESDHNGVCRSYDLQGFELAGADRQFYLAKAEFRWQTNEVFLTAPEVPEPVAIRYCFRDWQPGNLLGGNELPCPPFRTDNWE